MPFFVLTPEDSGRPEPARPGPGGPLFVFDTWVGDDLVRAHPAFLVTTALKNALEALPQPRGFRAVRARVERSRFLKGQRPGLRLPAFWALEVDGIAGVQPLGRSADGSLVVSHQALDCLVRHRIPHVRFAQFLPPGPEREGPVSAEAAEGPNAR